MSNMANFLRMALGEWDIALGLLWIMCRRYTCTFVLVQFIRKRLGLKGSCLSNLNPRNQHVISTITTLKQLHHFCASSIYKTISSWTSNPITLLSLGMDTSMTLSWLPRNSIGKKFTLLLRRKKTNKQNLRRKNIITIMFFVWSLGMLGSIDANTGSPDLGWDTDQFPMDIRACTAVMLQVIRQVCFCASA